MGSYGVGQDRQVHHLVVDFLILGPSIVMKQLYYGYNTRARQKLQPLPRQDEWFKWVQARLLLSLKAFHCCCIIAAG